MLLWEKPQCLGHLIYFYQFSGKKSSRDSDFEWLAVRKLPLKIGAAIPSKSASPSFLASVKAVSSSQI